MHTITNETMQLFQVHLYENEKSRATIKKYTCAVGKLKEYLQGGAIDKHALLLYREALSKTKQASTVNAELSAIRSYLSCFQLEEYSIRLLKVQHQPFYMENKELSREEYFRLIGAAKEEEKERLLLVMETICAAGIRVSELKYITVAAARSGRVVIALKGKVRTILLPGQLCQKLLTYAGEASITCGEIFLTKNKTSLSRKQIWSEMKALCKAADVAPEKVFPHNLRHLFARCFYHEHRDVVMLSDLLGHSSVETTRIYLKSSGREHSRMIESLDLVG